MRRQTFVPWFMVLLVAALSLAACASTPKASSGASTLEGGVKIGTAAGTPGTSTGPAIVRVTLSDTRGLAGSMSLTATPNVVPQGDVTFVVKNTGTVEHEAIVLKTDTPFDKIPVADAGDPPAPVKSGANKVDEATNIGETGDPNLKPGDTRTFTIKQMAEGSYAIVCNLADHYAKGMRAPLTVTAPRSTVNVTLSDTHGLAGSMSLTVSPSTVPQGDVTFVVKNTGTIEHEAVVLKTNTRFDKLPVTFGGDPPAPVKSGGDKVSEDTNIGETGDPNLKPGDTRTFTIKQMAAGSYAIVCNLADHYAKGMRAALTVTPPHSTVDVTLSDSKGLSGSMSLSVSPPTAVAGDVTFVVKNTGTIEHEAIVLKTNTPFDKIPVADAGDPPAPVPTGANKVDEATNIGETGDPNLKPGTTRTFTIKHMTAGSYAIVCNLADHYAKGMRAPFTVTTPHTTVNVTLSDPRGLNGPMSLTVSPDSAPAGDVTFVVKNTGTIEHEAVVLKTDTPFDKLPVTFGGDPPAPVKSGGNKVDEAANIGETGDPNLKPGDTRTFTIEKMTAGGYVIVCNLANHYAKGMRAAFTVG